ncbi:MAG: alcohol dehydrogenase catalytic domain-containing protein [Synergistaceae bacterium]|nr:alcohol dehydrogenase catalytic domain-containing protein [Synergistaceae bacterium]
MKAAVWYGHRDVRVEETSRPSASPGHVVVEVRYAGICGTDRHEYVGPVFIPTARPHRLTGKTAPLIIGHEFCGVISEVGDGVTGWHTGDRVTANGTLSCGKCEACLSGRYNVCEKLGFLGVNLNGAFAEYVEVEAARLFRIPDSVPMRDAVLTEPLACGIHATKLMGGVGGQDVVIVGPGIIGIGALLAARHDEARGILVIGVGDLRRELVESLGGSYFDLGVGDPSQAVREWSHGRMADAAYECVGSQAALDSCVSMLKPGGKLMVMGVFEHPPTLRMNDFQEGERRLFTSQAHTSEIQEALDRIEAGEIDVGPLITREVTLDTLVKDGLEELMRNGERHIKVIIDIQEKGAD